MVHHSKKGESTGGDSVLGSTAIIAAFDAVLYMGRSENIRNIWAEGREGIDLEKTIIELDEATGVVTAKMTVANAIREDTHSAVMAALGDAEMGQQEIKDIVGGNNISTSYAIKDLITSGQIIRTGTGKRGDPHKYSAAEKLAGFLSTRDAATSNLSSDPQISDSFISDAENMLKGLFSSKNATEQEQFSWDD